MQQICENAFPKRVKNKDLYEVPSKAELRRGHDNLLTTWRSNEQKRLGSEITKMFYH